MDDRRRGAHIKMMEGLHFPGEPILGGGGRRPPKLLGLVAL